MKSPFAKAFLKDDNGVAATEFAMIAPILCVLLIGIIDYGAYIKARMELDDLARATAEYAVQGGDPEEAIGDVVEESEPYQKAEEEQQALASTAEETCECADGVEVECTASCGEDDYVRHFFTVTIEKNYTPLFAYPGIGENLTIRGHSRLQFEGSGS